MPDENEKILTVAEAAALLRLPVRTMHHYVRIGRIPSVQLVKRRLILRETIEAILAQGRMQEEQSA